MKADIQETHSEVKSSLAMLGFKINYLEECEMATVGQQLLAPEAGWKRLDLTDSNFEYTGGNYDYGTNPTKVRIYNYCNMKFNFTGSKFRLLVTTDSSTSSGGKGFISIDGEAEVAFYTSSLSYDTFILIYEVTNLDNDQHYVTIRDNGGFYLVINAIDIDENGELKPYNPNPTPAIPTPTNLTATAGDSKVTLSWAAVTDATGYDVKRSTTAGGPYTAIASNVSGTNYVDNTAVNGSTYYYVITALTADGESANSNEASATPTASGGNPGDGDQAILRITMNDSSEREYKVSKVIADDFVSWCNRAIGTGNSCYVFDKGAQNSKEYLFYEKIISFEVIPVA